jgi:hypothetical protein
MFEGSISLIHFHAGHFLFSGSMGRLSSPLTLSKKEEDQEGEGRSVFRTEV